MNADRLLAHFEKISDAPDAVDRLRRFILDLAVRGKLVEQDSREGTAQELLALHGVRMGETGETPPFPVPQSWTWLAIGDVCSKTGSGSTPRGGKAAYKSSGIPFLRSQNVHDDGLKLDDVAFIDAATHHRMTGTAVQPDDLLLNITGGSMGRCCHVPSSFREGNVSQHVAILRVAIPGTQAFLHKCIISPFFQSLIFDEQTGAGRGGLPKNRMDRLPVPLPPLAEQHRIVEKVDELMLLCDRLEASQTERESRRDRLVVSSLSRLGNPSGSDPDEFKKDAGFHLRNLNRLSTKPEHIKEIRRAILNLAVRGRLVPQDEKGNSAADLPFGWHQHAIADLLDGDSQNGYSKKPDDDPSGVPILRISAATVRSDCIIAEEEFKLISGLSTQQQNQFALMPGDLLACRFNGNKNYVGRMAEYRGSLGKQFVYPDKLIRLRLNREKAIPALVRHFSQSDIVRHEIEQHCATTVGNWGISATNLKAVPIPLPPLAEQKRIVAKVDELMAICDQLEKQLESQRKESRRLLEALLHETLEEVE